MTYAEEFSCVHGYQPYPYQERVAEALLAGRSVFLRAPTGSGKTKAVLTPFLLNRSACRPRRLIYALPLRSLVHQIHAEAAGLLERCGFSQSEATIQTGEQPDDEFFDRGRVIVTTYDQVLSGLLCAPYGLSRRLANVNAAAIVGALVVFDEFHLMGLDTALLTGAAGLRLFDSFTQSVWMSATATEAPAKLLGHALGCVPMSLEPDEMAALPAVASTRRELRFGDEPLTAEVVKRYADGRTIVIANTVDRAQTLYRELKSWAAAQTPPIPCHLLHARFFKRDRDRLVALLSALYGEGTLGPAILVATQVVEAGVNISCDHLFSELCPMNALLQRAGRCARFADERGVVHVHALPPDERSWLPYGTPQRPDPALAATLHVLGEQPVWTMSPRLAEEWVQRVHGEADERVLAGGYQARLAVARRCIQAHVTSSESIGVSDYIRQDDGAMIRLLIAEGNDLPSRPGRREALQVSRFAVRRLLRDGAPIGWWWDLGAEQPIWRPIETWDQLVTAYVVCLSPSVAAYSEDEGLRLGERGEVVSDEREPPRLRRQRPLRLETWIDHTRAVAAEADRRWAEDGDAEGLLARGGRMRQAFPAAALRQAVQAGALLHDLGKLQVPWQAWAEAYQRDLDPSRSYAPLAHTAYDATNPADRARERRVQPRRPAHAVASAWYGLPLLPQLLDAVADVGARTELAAACLAAIVAHHGGWFASDGVTLDAKPLVPGWEELVCEAIGVAPPAGATQRMDALPDRRGTLARYVDPAMHPDRLEKSWALVAYLMRLLRLADQRATAEGGSDE